MLVVSFPVFPPFLLSFGKAVLVGCHKFSVIFYTNKYFGKYFYTTQNTHMTPQELKEKLFDENNTIYAFAKSVNADHKALIAKFRAKELKPSFLAQLAAWKGVPEADFNQWVKGPAGAPLKVVKNIPKNSGTGRDLHEPAGEYGNKKEVHNTSLTGGNSNHSVPSPISNDQNMIMKVVMEMLVVQKEQNAAMLKLANAAEINAITIARLNGISGA